MNKPKQKIINWKKKTGWSKTEQVGYNQAVSDYDAWILERLDEIMFKHNIIPRSHEEALIQLENKITNLVLEIHARCGRN